MHRRTHRSFVSYIDKSREYYAAQGYEHPYRWAVLDEIAFAPLSVALADARVGVVTTASFPAGSEPAGIAATRPKQPFAAPLSAARDATMADDLFWARDETHLDDLDSYLPLQRLTELVAAGQIADLSPRFYGVPTEYSQRRTIDEHAPQIARWMSEDDVDVALLVPL